MNIVRGRSWGPMRRVIYGPPGVGKSTFACRGELGCKGVLALDYESGLDQIGPDRVAGPTTWAGTLALVREAVESRGDWDTVVIDTADKLEEQAAKELCAKAKKEFLTDFGYGDGYFAVAAKWRELLSILEGARAKGRSVHLVGHVQASTVRDPTLPRDHQKFIAALTKHSWGATHQWADAILFADYERGMSESRAVMTGERVLCTVAGTGFDAKHRPNIRSRLPLSWVAYEREFRRFERSCKQILEAIRSKASSAPKGSIDEAAFRAAVDAAGEDVEKLVRIECKLEEKIENTPGGTPNGQPAQAPTSQPQETKAS